MDRTASGIDAAAPVSLAAVCSFAGVCATGTIAEFPLSAREFFACCAAFFSACFGGGYSARSRADDILRVGYVSNRASTALSSIEFGLSC